MSPAPHLLIVEDDAIIAGNLFAFFEKRGFVVDAAYDGRAALQRLATNIFDAVVLDVGLPGVDGFTVLHGLRNTLGLATPVLMLTARDDIADKLAGFEHGADDYVTKPFVLVEVEARIRALLARASGHVATPLRRFGRLMIDGRRHEVRVDERPVRLTPKGWSILEALLRDPGRVVSRAELEAAAWGDDPPDTDALRGQVHLMRKALADAGFDGVRTVHGIGWQLIGDGDTS